LPAKSIEKFDYINGDDMKTNMIIFILCISVLTLHAQNQNSSYYLIRHAEKVVSENPDPELKVKGQLRSEKWADVFKHISFDVIYSTDYKRTVATAQPTAESQNLDVLLYDHNTIDYQQFLRETVGKTVLIVGHSNSTPEFVNKLIGMDKYEQIEHHNNGNLYIVDILGDVIVDKLLYIE
jgi:broad specificity phosphatase PhoE